MATTKIPQELLEKTSITFADGEILNFGASNDLQIYHSGSYSFIRDVGTNGLYIDTNGPGIYLRGTTGNKWMLKAIKDGAVELYHNDVKKFYTNTSGVDIVGTAALTGGITIQDDQVAYFGTGLDLRISHVSSSGSNLIQSYTSGELVIESNGNTKIRTNNADDMAKFLKNGAVELYYDNVKKFETTSAGATVTGDFTASSHLVATSGGLTFGNQDFYLYRSAADIATLRVGDSGSYKYFSFTDTGSVTRFSSASGSVSLGSGANDHLLIKNTGNVGIGTTSPTSKLEVHGSVGVIPNTTNSSLAIRDTSAVGADNGGSIVFSGIYTGTSGFLGSGPYIKAYKLNATSGDYSYGLKFATRQNGVGSQAIGLTITPDQKVGIGTTSPAVELDLRGNMRLDGSSGTDRSIYFRNQGSVGGSIQSDKDLSLWAGNGSGSATRYLTIEEGGNVGIGTTNPGMILDVDGSSAANDVARFSGPNSGGLTFRNATSNEFIMHTATSDALIFGTNGNTERMRIGAGGAIDIANNQLGWYSNTDSAWMDGVMRFSNLNFKNAGGTTRMYIAGSTGKVGIGIGSGAVSRLHVRAPQSDTMTAANAFAAFDGTGGDGIIIGARASSPFGAYIQSGYTPNIGTSHHYPLLLNPHGGNVGINCIAPEEKLTVDGGLKIANNNNRLYFGTEGGTSIRALEGNSTGSVIQVGEGYTNVLLGSASAKVGIRQTSPDAMLHIDGASNSIAGLIIEGSGNGDVIHQQFKAKASNGTLSYHGISASPGADQDDNTISLGNGAGNGVVVNHQNVVRTRYSEIHSGGTFAYDVGGNYLGANGSGFGTHAIFRTPSVSSPSSGAASTQFLTVYSSGHWGEYALARFRLYTTYFQAGYREYLFRMVAGTCNLEEVTAYGSNTSIGSAPGTITKGSVTDTGTDHSGQNIYKVDLTFASTSAYYRNYVVAEIGFGSNKYYSSATSASTLNANTNGGKYHFKTISLAEGRGKFTA